MVHFWLSWTPEVLSFGPLVPEPLTVSLSYKGLYSWDDEWMQLMTRQDGKLAGRWQSKTRIRTFAPVCVLLKWHSRLLWFLTDFDGAHSCRVLHSAWMCNSALELPSMVATEWCLPHLIYNIRQMHADYQWFLLICQLFCQLIIGKEVVKHVLRNLASVPGDVFKWLVCPN